MKGRSIKFIDLFCGIGSFHHSFKRITDEDMGSRWECVFACDIDVDVRNTYQKNYGVIPDADICKVDMEKVPAYDVLCAGFPCQPFSNAGKHKGFTDDRGNMFLQTMRFVNHHQPKVVILENVVGLLSHEKGQTFKIILKTLKEAGYHVNYKVLKCSDYGIPQMRRRVFIIATNTKTHNIEFSESILDFKDDEKTTDLTTYLDNGYSFTKNVAYTIRCGGKHSPIDGRHNWDGYYVTKKGQSGSTVYRLTLKDCLKLQGFDPEEFVLVGPEKASWKMVGNTIPTIFTLLIGKAVGEKLCALESTEKKRKNSRTIFIDTY